MKVLINALIVILILISSLFIIVIATYPYDIEEFSHGARLIGLFVIIYLMTIGYLKLFDHRFSSKTIKVTILAPVVLFTIAFLFISSVTNTIKISPLYITWVLGFLAGIAHYQDRFKVKKLILFALFPVIMSFNLYDLWMHRIEYGNFDGFINSPVVIPFEFVNNKNETISNENLKGKIVLLDFWFIGCPPCWKAFPEVQKVYDENIANQSFALYAVNRGEDPENVFARIEEKGFSFPVLLGTQEKMDDLGVYFYPTVILLNKEGEIAFRGEIEEAKSMLDDLLKE